MNLNELPIVKEVDDELGDELYENCTHGTAYCYGKGCRGPICRKLNRDRKRSARDSDAGPGPLDEYLNFRLSEHEEMRKSRITA